jgi:hypothetical protein
MSQQQQQHRQYPMLESCRVVVLHAPATAGGTKHKERPPVRLPPDCWQAAAKNKPTTNNNNILTAIYDFALERDIVQIQQPDRHGQLEASLSSTSRDELQQNILVKMKSVTKAGESVCIALLEEHNFDLKTSVEAFFAPSSS